ncbi:hypothetical protein Lal_00014530, partial [Lupinus albus]
RLTYIRYPDISWLVEQGFEFPHQLELQRVNTFLEFKGNNYSSLIREFYSNSSIMMNEQWECFDAVEQAVGVLLVWTSLFCVRRTNQSWVIEYGKLTLALFDCLYLVNWPIEILRVVFGIASSSSQILTYGNFISRTIDHLEIYTFDVEFTLTNTREHLVGEHLIYKMSIYWYTDHVEIDLSDEEHHVDLHEQHQDPPQVEASQVPQVPPFGLAHLDAMEQRLNDRIDARFQSMNERIYSGLMSLYDMVASDIQKEIEQTINDIDRISFIMRTMSSFSNPPPQPTE